MISANLRVSPEQFTNAIEELRALVAIPSVSHPESPYHSMKTLANAADFIRSRLEKLDFQARCVSVEGSAPYVIAERIVDIAKPTLLLYAHYDVQPVDEDKWSSKPFEVVERDGRLYGRGASDDKAGVVAILTAIQVYKDSGRELPVNIKFLSEGEEEYGSSHMSALLAQEAKRLHADAMVILDSLNKNVSTGTLTSSTRGIVNLTLEVNALKQPKHSGLACLVPCPAIALAVLVSSLQHPEEIPGFMEDVMKMTSEEREIYRRGSTSEQAYKHEMEMVPEGVLRGNPDTSVYERLVETPSITIVNMNAGKPNGGNSIQDKAGCTISIRTVAGQDPERIGEVVKKHLESQKVPGNLPFTVTVKEGCYAWKGNVTLPFSQKYFESLAENFKENCAVPCGGGLPLINDFEHSFRKIGLSCPEMIIPGIEDPKTNAHSHNESQSMELLENSINTLVSFFGKAGDVKVKS